MTPDDVRAAAEELVQFHEPFSAPRFLAPSIRRARAGIGAGQPDLGPAALEIDLRSRGSFRRRSGLVVRVTPTQPGDCVPLLQERALEPAGVAVGGPDQEVLIAVAVPVDDR